VPKGFQALRIARVQSSRIQASIARFFILNYFLKLIFWIYYIMYGFNSLDFEYLISYSYSIISKTPIYNINLHLNKKIF